eukprot:TRINITY_DN25676_c0_g1_i1.p1 TRINITY_DN25676_c0_g1~~TRINITY_DN25676_c0_g1_i1.p1  ORF type:complete len:481 (-),score=81.74 TRINITY_DN25676_c0_g1_i1:102-1544(-)
MTDRSTGGGAQRQVGHALLQDLLSRPPGAIADWAIEQARMISTPGVDVEQQPIFQVASALAVAPQEEKQALIRGAISGFGELPKQRRTEVVRLAMKSTAVVQQATLAAGDSASLPFSRSGSNNANVVDASVPKAANDVPNSTSSLADSGGNKPLKRLNSLDAATQSPLGQNLARIMKDTGLAGMSASDRAAISQVAQTEAVRLAQPSQLLDIVSELNEREREQLTEALVEAHVVPEEQRGVLEEAVRPGGYADKLSVTLDWVAKAREHIWVVAALPLGELLVGMLLGLLSCGTPLISWLRYDAVFALGAAGALYFTGHTLSPVYAKLAADPIGAVQRWQSTTEVRTWAVRLETAVPGVEIETYRLGAIGLGLSIVLVLVGAVWAVIGLLELLASSFFGCNGFIVFVCLLLIVLRFGVVVGIVLLVFYVLDELQKHRSRAPMLGSTSLFPSMSEETQVHMPFLPQPGGARQDPPSHVEDFM